MSAGGVALAYDDRAFLMEGAWFWPAYPGPRTRFHVCAGAQHMVPSARRVSRAPCSTSGPPPVCGRRGRSRPRRAGSGPRSSMPSSPRPERTDRWGRLRAANLLEQLLIGTGRGAGTACSCRGPVAGSRLWTLLAQGTPLQPDYDALAQELGMGLSTLRRRFKAATGLALHQYALQSRMAVRPHPARRDRSADQGRRRAPGVRQCLLLLPPVPPAPARHARCVPQESPGVRGGPPSHTPSQLIVT